MKRLLIITGDLATGKSTFAGILSRRYRIAVMYKDKIKEVLGDTVGFADREENLRLSRATMELMIYGFSELAALGKSGILEANFRSGEMERLHDIAAQNGYEVLTLALRGEVNILYERFINRVENEGRHPVHISGFDGFTSFKNYIEMGRNERTFSHVIEVAANDFSYQKNGELLSKLDIFIGE